MSAGAGRDPDVIAAAWTGRPGCITLGQARLVSLAQLAQATGLDEADLGERIAAYAAAQPQPWLVDTVDADGVMHGKTYEGIPFTIGPALSADEMAALTETAPADLSPAPNPAPVDVTPTPEEATIDLTPKRVEVPLTEQQVADTYREGAKRGGRKHGGAMGRKGEQDNREPDPNSLLPRSYAMQLKESGA